ncbi:MAG: hypothetical protein IKU68_06245 [Oscillospiraceae bacterium]|nr:hypothetical protein [Oscillospiraceae bacterium]
MNRQQLQNEITAHLWSGGLKSAIAEKGHIFTERELLGIAFHYAPSFAERLRLMQLLAEHAPTVSDHAERCISWQKKALDQFKVIGEQELYELRIKGEPDAYEERYLCASFEAALEMIDKFYQEYDFTPETEQARYIIEKRKIFRAGQPFSEDGLGECVLSAGKVMVSVDAPAGETENGPCPHFCGECENPCVLDIDVCFPAFLADRSPVRYRLPDGQIRYGIHLNPDHSEWMDCCYIIPFEGEMLSKRKYEELWGEHWHEHILCPYVEAVAVDTLSTEHQECYHAFAKWLDGNAGIWKQQYDD